MYGKQNIEYGAVIIKRLQVFAVLLPLVFISVVNCSDMYLLVRISRLATKFPQVRFRHEVR